MLKAVHNKLVFSRRIKRLAAAVAERLPYNARVLDVGCGSGDLARLLMEMRPDIHIQGIDVFVRSDTAIPVTEYDGARIPFPNDSFDAAIVIDVLHHTDDPEAVLAEIVRVAPRIILKDHLRDSFTAETTLRLMDWVGNAAHGVRLPYNYLSYHNWRSIWDKLQLSATAFTAHLGLYPRPFSFLFDRRLHFITVLSR